MTDYALLFGIFLIGASFGALIASAFVVDRPERDPSEMDGWRR